MRKAIFAAASMLIAAPAAAQDWRSGPEYDVLLTTYDIAPKEIRLKAGQPVRLRLVNNSNQGLSFSAKSFFRSAQARQRDGDGFKSGTIKVAPLSTETIVVVPKAGRYKVAGGSFLHRLLGMSGKIVVE
jgi:uncharacterized cupredoxin-like copper-binding protein